MKRCSTSLIIKEIQNTTRMAKIGKGRQYHTFTRMWGNSFSNTADESIIQYNYTTTLQKYLVGSIKANIHTPYDPAILHLANKDVNICSPKDMFKTTLLIIAQTWKQPKYPSTID